MRVTCAVALLSTAIAGCSLGRIGDRNDPSGRGGADDVAPAAKPETPAFGLPADQPQLLPYWVRMQKVSNVVGLPLEDPIFDLLRTNHIELGDYDHAKGVQPNRMWTPARMGVWAKSLKPVCGSTAMKEMYTALPGELDALVAAAHGRAATDEDRAAIDASLEGLPLDPDARYEAVCLAVLSTAEFVIQ